MLSLDISRDSFQRSKNYTGLRQQHGRVINESELNESGDIAAEELRRAIQDVICSSGTPDDGFRVSFSTDNAPSTYDFDLAKGTYYIGGRRYDCFGSTFLNQLDWLQLEHDHLPLPELPLSARHDFVYLEGMEQSVSATEDSELFERALGGGDGAGRLRRMARVNVVTGSADSCIEAMEALFPEGMIGADTMALNTGAGLTVDFDPDHVEENLCVPEVQQGFLGAENETFRVQLTAPDRFIYGRDNASHLYRVTLAADPADAAQTIVTFLTRPRDVNSQPLAQQAVEILRWTTTLPNGEHLAEPIGQLANILTDYNPETATLHIAQDVAALDVNWDGAPTEDRFFYLRIWTGGSGSTPADHPIVDETAITLAGTGLTAAFAQAPDGSFGMAGDYWVVAARPNAPDVVTPWRLMEDAADTPPPSPPHGPMRHVAPLAIISWEVDAAGTALPSVHDCRERFRKLCMVPTCCEVTVGDGEHSHGDESSIAEAIARLPPSGGKVCLLRGTFVESVDLEDRDNITISGCGDATVWQAAEGPALSLVNCHGITLRNFRMEADSADVVLAGSRTGATDASAVCSGLAFEGMTFLGRDLAALWLNDCDRTRIVGCHVEMRALSTPRTVAMGGTDPAIFARGDEVLIENNWVGVTPDPLPPVESRPLGGVQVGGLSENVTIRNNRIVDGKGNGITLGHLEWVADGDSGAFGLWTLGITWIINDAGCIVPDITVTPPPGGDPSLVPESGGEIRALRIEDNLIRNMGLNGIAVCHFFDLAEHDDMIAVSDLRIERNEIRDCLTSDLETPAPEVSYFSAYGGIALASCDLLYIRDNRIQDNGRATSAPVCGVFVLFGQGIEIDDNHIFANGAPTEAIGRLGGVHVGWCLTPDTAEADRSVRATPIRRAALAMSGNVIDSPNGQAIKAIALGPVQITNNQLVGTAREVSALLQLLGLIIAVLPPFTSLATLLTSLAVTDGIDRNDFADADLLLAELIIAAMGGQAVSVFNSAWLEEFSGLIGGTDSGRLFPAVGGETMFNDNQVSLLPALRGAVNPISSVLLASMDDVSMNANQVEADLGVGFILANAFTPAATVRMNGNRVQETPATCLYSGLSHSVFLNTQALNQGTHCFAATALFDSGSFVIQRQHNLSLLESLIMIADDDNDDDGYCQMLQDWMSDLFGDDELQAPIPNFSAGIEVPPAEPPSDVPDTGDDHDRHVPDVLCATEDEAATTLNAAGYAIEVINVYVPGVTKPRVLQQSPPAGVDLEPGEKVSIVIGVDDPSFRSSEELTAEARRCAEIHGDGRADADRPGEVFDERLDYRLGGYTLPGRDAATRRI